MTFQLFISENKERIKCAGKWKDLKPLEISNTFISCVKQSSIFDEEVFIKFHNNFYDIYSNPTLYDSILKILLQVPNKEDTYSISSPEKVLEYPNTKLTTLSEKIQYEADTLKNAIKIWLGYHKGVASPSRRFGVMSDMYSQYSEDYKIYLKYFMSCSDIIEREIASLLDSIYYSFNTRTKNVGKQIIPDDGKIKRLYISEGSLLDLAWCELEYYIEHNSFFKECKNPECRIWFKVPAGKSTRLVDNLPVNTGYMNTNMSYCSDACRKKTSEQYRSIYNKVNKQYGREENKILKSKLCNLRREITEGKRSGTLDISALKNKYKEIIKNKKEHT